MKDAYKEMNSEEDGSEQSELDKVTKQIEENIKGQELKKTCNTRSYSSWEALEPEIRREKDDVKDNDRRIFISAKFFKFGLLLILGILLFFFQTHLSRFIFKCSTKNNFSAQNFNNSSIINNEEKYY